MDQLYVEIEVTDNRGTKNHFINTSNISYFRDYLVDGGNIKTAIFQRGTDKQTVMDINPQKLLKKISKVSHYANIMTNLDASKLAQLEEFLGTL